MLLPSELTFIKYRWRTCDPARPRYTDLGFQSFQLRHPRLQRRGSRVQGRLEQQQRGKLRRRGRSQSSAVSPVLRRKPTLQKQCDRQDLRPPPASLTETLVSTHTSMARSRVPTWTLQGEEPLDLEECEVEAEGEHAGLPTSRSPSEIHCETPRDVTDDGEGKETTVTAAARSSSTIRRPQQAGFSTVTSQRKLRDERATEEE